MCTRVRDRVRARACMCVCVYAGDTEPRPANPTCQVSKMGHGCVAEMGGEVWVSGDREHERARDSIENV